jgi:hypothetical protein
MRLKYKWRTSLVQLRERHLDGIDYTAEHDTSTRPELIEVLSKNYMRFHGRLPWRGLSLPSDKLRKLIMVSQIADLVEVRRDEIQAAALHEEIAAYDSAYGY